MNRELAELLGLLCAEGCHVQCTYERMQFDKRRGKAYRSIEHRNVIEFSNTNMLLLKRFAQLVDYVYGYSPNITCIKCGKPKITLARKHIVKDLLSYSNYGSAKWIVPKEMMSTTRSAKAAFIRGLFDGDGTFSKKTVRLYSCNIMALRKVSKVLDSLNLEHTMQGPSKVNGKMDMFTLNVLASQHATFMSLVNPIRYKPS